MINSEKNNRKNKKYNKHFTTAAYLPAFFIGLSILTGSCSSKQSNSSSPSGSVKFRQYYLQGEVLYNNNCGNCHQKDGAGLRRLIPPLKSSDFMKDNLDKVICLIKNGKSDSTIVNGILYTQPMPDNLKLTDLEIAEIATYIYNSWNHEEGIVEVTQVSLILHNCK